MLHTFGVLVSVIAKKIILAWNGLPAASASLTCEENVLEALPASLSSLVQLRMLWLEARTAEA